MPVSTFLKGLKNFVENIPKIQATMLCQIYLLSRIIGIGIGIGITPINRHRQLSANAAIGRLLIYIINLTKLSIHICWQIVNYYLRIWLSFSWRRWRNGRTWGGEDGLGGIGFHPEGAGSISGHQNGSGARSAGV